MLHELRSLSDDDLIKRASRELYISAIVPLEHIQNRPYLVETMPEELATLIQAIAASVATANREFMTVLDITDRIRRTLAGSSDGGEVRDDYADVFEAFTQAKKH